jgi:hypothetical protein
MIKFCVFMYLLSEACSATIITLGQVLAHPSRIDHRTSRFGYNQITQTQGKGGLELSKAI